MPRATSSENWASKGSWRDGGRCRGDRLMLQLAVTAEGRVRTSTHPWWEGLTGGDTV